MQRVAGPPRRVHGSTEKTGPADYAGAIQTGSAQQPSATILDRNLAALRAWSPLAAALLRQAVSSADVYFLETDENLPAVILGTGSAARSLCSRRRPLEEARRFAATLDVSRYSAVALSGFGAGYHALALLERLGTPSVVLVFEPDVPFLRAVLSRVDFSSMFATGCVRLVTDARSSGQMANAVNGVQGVFALAQGIALLRHPGFPRDQVELAAEFERTVTSTIQATRTALVTTLVQSETTFRNLLMNVDRYVTTPGVDDLKGAAAGRPAIVVSAGPSLRRNIDLLARPGVRDRFVIIAVQTVLKPLLARGIRPHYVTTLDYHEISRRFYEGLTARDVEGVTLIADPKVNPAVLEVFPGAVRVPGDGMLPGGGSVLDALLGPALTRAKGVLPPGATVAHMAYYLARHLGCDPVILIGQDLGFTDGQYYAAGAAIHQVWSGELNEFNTLEMMEWQRIARLRYRLPDGQFNARPTTDVLGRRIYTDEQMATYLLQFERDFAADAARGLTTIDATEGGVAKQNAAPMRLTEVLERYGGRGEAAEGAHGPASAASAAREVAGRLAAARARLRAVRQDVWKVADHSRRAAVHLEEMTEHHADQGRVNRLIARVHELRDSIEKLEPAFDLVQRLNQTGVLKRARADRRLSIEEPGLTPLERQKRQIERDLVNVQWLADAADLLGRMLDDAAACLDGAPKQTSDPEPGGTEAESSKTGAEAGAEGGAGLRPAARRVWALIPLDPARSGLDTTRDLSEPFLVGCNPFRLTLLRLARARALEGIAVLAEDPEAARRLAGPLPESLRIRFMKTEGPPLGGRPAAIRGARLWSRACWRGGLGTFTIYDEALGAPTMLRAMESLEADAAAIVNADWALIDPALVDAAVERYRQRPTGPGAYRLTFCQAPPGLGCCVIERALMRDLAERQGVIGPAASIGGLIGFLPLAPTSDPIAKPNCIAAPAAVRDAQFRFIPDAGPRRAILVRALSTMGDALIEAPAESIAAAVGQALTAGSPEAPQELILELCTGRRTCGLRLPRAHADPPERPVMSPALAERLLGELGAARADAALTLAGAGDPLHHPDWARIVGLARRAGIGGIHIRTDLVAAATEPEQLGALLECGADVISVDLMAESAEAYRAVMGADLFARARTNLVQLLERRAARPPAGGLPVPWIVPRLTRCDAVYDEIEPFFDRWTLAAGCAVIDPLPAPIPGDRIEPLPIPAGAAGRLLRERMLVLCDGRVPASWSDLSGDRVAGDAAREGLLAVWRRIGSRRPGLIEPKPVELPSAPLHGGAARARVAYLSRES